MPKFRTNHGRGDRRNNSFAGRMLILIIVAVALIFFVIFMLKSDPFGLLHHNTGNTGTIDWDDLTGMEYIEPKDRFYLPSSTTGQIVHHKYYSLSYNEKFEEAEWVAYLLTKYNLKIPNVHRAKRFNPDTKVKTRSAIYYDYSGSGYTRGHLVPAGDMAFSDEAMKETFLMSNITPQKKRFNAGIWLELEENVRNWAWKNKRLYIAAGPVLTKDVKKYIGKNKVGVPRYFYKVIMDIDDPGRKAIGFIIPNEKSTIPLKNYAVTVDSVEALTGIDFFKDLLTDKEEEKLESTFNIHDWKISNKLYKKRLETGNK